MATTQKKLWQECEASVNICGDQLLEVLEENFALFFRDTSNDLNWLEVDQFSMDS